MSLQQKSVLAVFAFILSFAASSCAKTHTVLVESAPAYQPKPSEATVRMPNVLPARTAEVQAAVHRIFKDDAVVDSSVNPNFLVGDFNGDASQDLAVVLKPVAGRVGVLNEQYPPWLLRDPLISDPTARPTISIEQEDLLLAIIHGYGENDWRDTRATQTFLLKNVVGSNMTVKGGGDFAQENSGKRLPRPQGDLIAENLRGVNGYLLYANSTYQWYDAKTFRPRTDVDMVHTRSSRK